MNFVEPTNYDTHKFLPGRFRCYQILVYFYRNSNVKMFFKLLSALMAIMLVAQNGLCQSIRNFGPVSPTANNTSLVVNPRNPSNLIMANGGGVWYSLDGGKAWENSISVDGVISPVVVANAKGDAHLLTVEQSGNGKSVIICRGSSDGGKTWSEPVPIAETITQDQRMPWAAYDSKENLYVTWSRFDQYKSNDQNCQSWVMLSRSSNGRKWSDPIEVSQTPGDCQDGKMAAAGSIPVVGIEGKMFVIWTHRDMIMLDRSFDGNLWLSNDIAFLQQKSGRSIQVPQTGLTNGKAILVSDKSKGDHRGLLYLIYADQRTPRNTDVYFSRSLNFGDLWINSEKIHDMGGAEHHQFLPWLTIDQSNGYIYILYYEMNEDGMVDVNITWSADAGQTFKTTKVNKESFKLEAQGTPEYIAISAHKGAIAAAWFETKDGKNILQVATLNHEALK